MSNQTSLSRFDPSTPPDGSFDDYLAIRTVPPSQAEAPGPFAAGLHYAAADLNDLVTLAPAGKRESLKAVIRLLRTLADT